MENKLDIKPIKEEMNKPIKLDHERNKRALNLIIFGIKEQEEDTLATVKEELKNKSQIDTAYLIEAKRLGKIIDHKDRLIHVKVSCNDHKYSILSKSPSLKGLRIFINEDLIPEDKDELRKEVQKAKEARKEGKWAIIRNRKAIVRDRDQNDNNKYEFETLEILFWNCRGFPWRKGPMISWIPSAIDIICLDETWEHEESKVPNIEGFVLW
jgi:hypothetical protein